MILIKLGGSVITDKTTYRKFHEGTVRRLAREILTSDEETIIVHGAGSFGHIYAKKFALNEGLKEKRQVEGVAKVMHDVRELDNLVVGVFNDEGLYAASVPPASNVVMKSKILFEMDMRPFDYLRKIGVTPITFGDVAMDQDVGVCVCSGDQLILGLAKHYKPDRVIFCSDVDGLYAADPNIDPDANLIEKINAHTLDTIPRTERVIDVSGSIYSKVEQMLKMAPHTKECIIINGNIGGRLADALAGKRVICSRTNNDI